MAKMAEIIGHGIMFVGGIGVGAFIVGLFCEAAIYIWKDVISEFRWICQCESLICEYRKERDSYLKWKEGASDEMDKR